MSTYLSRFYIDSSSAVNEKQVISFDTVRFSVITPSLLRVEKSPDKIFCDEPTQSVINRDFCETSFSVDVIGTIVIIKTEKVKFIYNLSKSEMESVTLADGRKVNEYHSGNLLGTCRTLDGVNGKTKLGEGVISTNGVAILDDSNTLLIKKNGKVLPRAAKESDVYYFAYGFNYRDAVKDLFKLTGNAPLIPRFTLGNWWSRYKAYTQDEYTELIDKFIENEIPVTVATIDMDWHWVDVVKRFGTDALDTKKKNSILELFYNTVFPGWTGYSWNTELFPDHKAFLSRLKENGFYITMNLHPASGCKFYEDAYGDFCSFMGIDKNTKEQIKFDITDEKFIEGYFKYLHHPHEEEGVDFWWIDWQQGKNSGIEGLDPLWALNHYHSIDLTRDGKRPLILSRFAGAGSHRYPLGFSGDTVQTWKSLAFQPYFTSTASNIGYTWWSHDIGGHCRGYRDDELYLRWVQYGVFSPIMRLHSTSNEFMGKEPWMYNKFTENTAADFLRLRHRLIPYLYSMNRRTETDGIALIEPMYYADPKDPRAYKCPNEFYFGSELIICPITEKCDEKTGLAGTKVYLPKGRFIDIFTGRIYNGNTITELFRDQSSIPVLAKEGAIIPLSNNYRNNNIDNPDSFEILISRGNNKFTLYEDDGHTTNYKNGAYCETDFSVKTTEKTLIFNICPVRGDASLIPENRFFELTFIDISNSEDIRITKNGSTDENFKAVKSKGIIKIFIDNVRPEDNIKISLIDFTSRKNTNKTELQTEIISKYKGSNDKKAAYFTNFIKKGKPIIIPEKLKKPLAELDEMVY